MERFVAPVDSSLLGRPVFWAELALICSPELLSRLGGSVRQWATKDEELMSALQLAAKHVQKECLVWTPYSANSGDAWAPATLAPLLPGSFQEGSDTTLSQTMSEHNHSFEASPTWQVEQPRLSKTQALLCRSADRRRTTLSSISDTASATGSWFGPSSAMWGGDTSADSDSDLDEDLAEPDPWKTLFPPVCLFFAPGLGNKYVQLFWLFAYFVGFCQTFYAIVNDSSHRKLIPLRSAWCVAYFGCMAAIPTLRGLKANRAARAALANDLRHSLARRAQYTTLLLFLLLMSVIYLWVIKDYFLQGKCLFRKCVVLFYTTCMLVQSSVAYLVFSGLVYATREILDGFNNRILGMCSDGGSTCCWSDLTRQTHELQSLIKDIWRPGELGLLVIASMVAHGAGCMMCLVLYLVHPEVPVLGRACMFTAAFALGMLVATKTYMLASISSKFGSKRLSANSIRLSIVQCYGRVPVDQRLDHHLCVSNLANQGLGIEVAPFGVVSKDVAFRVSRFIFALLPAVLAYSLSAAEAAGASAGAVGKGIDLRLR